MKRLFTGITILFLVLLLIIGCNKSTQNQLQTITFENKTILKIDQVYDTDNIKFKVNSITLLKASNNSKFDVINIIGEITALEENVYWSPENSIMIINNNENTVPLLLNKLNLPLNVGKIQEINLIAYVTETKIEDIKTIKWNIEQPIKKVNNDLILSNRNNLDINFNF